MTARKTKSAAKSAVKPAVKNNAKKTAKKTVKNNAKLPFWSKPLEDLTRAQWESLCDGCGRCCLVKLEDEDTGRIHFTDVTCRLFDAQSCRCKDYPGRKAKVPDCVKLTPKRVREIPWLPPTCAYRLVAEGKELYPWHPLISGDPDSVHKAGVSVRGRAGPHEDEIALPDVLDRIVRWPGMAPRAKKG